jgi:hypothetical protein
MECGHQEVARRTNPVAGEDSAGSIGTVRGWCESYK